MPTQALHNASKRNGKQFRWLSLGDIRPELAASIVREINQRDRRRAPKLSAGLREALRARKWRGNVRELRGVLESALLDCDGGELLPEHLPESREDERGEEARMPTMEETVRTAAARAMEFAERSRRRAAALLRISRRRLDRILDDGITEEPGESEGRPGSPGEEFES